MGYKRQSLIKLLLSHHPSCYLYRNHLLKIPGLKNYPLCLGCSGFYPSLVISFILSFFGIFGNDWLFLVGVSFLLFLPTILRFFIHVPTRMKFLRFITKIFLGSAVGIGLYTISIAPDILIMVLQFIIGIGLYAGMTYQRIKDPWPECAPCSFNPSPACPGMSSFHEPDIPLGKDLNTETDEG